MASQLEHTTEVDGPCLRLHMRGELVMQTVSACKREVFADIERHQGPVREVRADLSGITEIDSSGLAFLGNLQKKAREIDAAFFVMRPSRKVRNLFDMASMDDLFKVED